MDFRIFGGLIVKIDFRFLVIFTLVTILSIGSVLVAPSNANQLQGEISGIVTDGDSGESVSGVHVEIFSCGQETPSGAATTGPKGSYRIVPVKDGCYLLRVSHVEYESSWYGDPPFKRSATQIRVENSPVAGINVPITMASAKISGKVTAAGKPLEGVWATAVSFDESGGGSISDGRTDAKGFYTIPVAPGKFVVLFMRPGYVSNIYGGLKQDPERVDVTEGSSTSGINMALTPGGKISGRVSDKEGRSLPGIQVAVQEQIFPVFTLTKEDGSFLLDGVPSGNHRIVFIDPSREHLNQWFDSQDNYENAVPVNVVPSKTVSGVKAILKKAGGISGWVTDRLGNGLSDVMVYAQSIDNDGFGNTATTGPTGEYMIGGLLSGRYTVSFTPYGKPYLPMHFPDSKERDEALSVEVKPPNVTYGIDQRLPDGVALYGKVLSPAGEPISGVYIKVFPASGESSKSVGYGFSEQDGTYNVTLPAGGYIVEFEDNGAYLSKWSGGYTDRRDAETVNVYQGEAVKLDVVLPLGGCIAGTVRNNLGEVVTGVKVRATEVSTGERSRSSVSLEDGSYTIKGLDTGQYILVASGSDAGYISNKYTQPVGVRAPDTTESVDFVMTHGGSVQGSIIDAKGSPLEGVRVEAYDPELWTEIAGTRTDDAGQYEIGGLQTNSYCLRFSKNEYTVQWYNGKTQREDAENIDVVGTSSIAGLDAVMSKGIPLTGIVMSSSGVPVYNAEVEIYGEVEDEPFDEVRTELDGRFTVPSLAPGSYRVRFGHDDHIPQWYGGKVRREATPIIVNDSSSHKLDITLDMSGNKVAGKMRNTDGEEVGQAWMTAIDAATGQEVADERICECSGKFNIPLHKGNYLLRVERHGKVYWFNNDIGGTQVLSVDGEVSGLEMIIGEAKKY